MEQKTSLYQNHLACGGKIVPFAGYLLPVQYETGVMKEHLAVRTTCGMFDVSHMGEIICKGKDAIQNLNHILTNDYTTMPVGAARYSPMCYPSGGVVDDLIVYKISDECYFIVVNASNKDKDFAWFTQHAFGDVIFTDISQTVGQIALQGPNAHAIVTKLMPAEALPTKYYTFRKDVQIGGIDCLISTTGYTGEAGYEIYVAAEQAPALWDMLLAAGKDEGLIPCGLGARDTLRLEAAMPLYGHEMDENIHPLETGLNFGVKMQKEDFIGKAGILEKGITRKRVGLKVTSRGIIREHETVFVGDAAIGQTTSGTHAPYLGYPIAMALVDIAHSEIGTKVNVTVRGRKIEAEIVPLPFYKRQA